MKSTPLQDYPIAGEGKEISEMKSKPDDEKPVTLVPTKVEATPGDEKDTGGSKNNKPQHEDHTAPRKRRRSLRSTNAIKLPERASLHYRRLDELFFQENDPDRDPIVRIGKLQLNRIHSSPNIYVVDNFLNPAELAHLHTMMEKKPRFRRSFVGNDSHFDTSQRTSTFLSLTKQHDATIAAMEHKAAQLLGCWSTQTIEPLQLVRYLPGQFFGAHHDLGDVRVDDDDETTTVVELPPKSLYARRRLVTLFVYCNALTDGGGGATHFTAVDVRVQPQPGRAVLFANIRSDGTPDARTLHAGEPPLQSTKYGLNIWVCEE